MPEKAAREFFSTIHRERLPVATGVHDAGYGWVVSFPEVVPHQPLEKIAHKVIGNRAVSVTFRNMEQVPARPLYTEAVFFKKTK